MALIIIPSTHDVKAVNKISANAFKQKRALKKMIIPDSVTDIGASAFYGCTIEEVTLPDTLAKIDKYTFAFSALKSVTIPDSVTEIDEYAFAGTSYLANAAGDSINFGTGLKKINDYAFTECGAKSITFPDSLEYIGKVAFGNNVNLQTVTFGAHAPSIQYNAFKEDSSIQYNTVNNVKYLGNATNDHLVAMGGSVSSSTLSIADGCEAIAANAFYQNSSIGTFEAPASLRIIGSSAFAQSSIRTVTFASNSKMEAIEKDAFLSAELNSITLPEGIKTIDDPFRLTDLHSLTIPASVTTMPVDSFMQIDLLDEIVVAEGNELYSSAHGCLFDKDKEKLLRVPNGLLHGDYTLPKEAPTVAKWAVLYPDTDVTITIPVEITNLENYALQDAQNTVRAGDKRHIIGVNYEGTVANFPSLILNSPAFVNCSGNTGTQGLKFNKIVCNNGYYPI